MPVSDPFTPITERREAAAADRARLSEAARAEISAAFGNAPIARAWLRERLEQANAQPSYRPGMDAATCAFNEGRRAVLRELVDAIDAALNR